MKNNNQKLSLISFNLCPFVQRSVITLLEKNVSYEIKYINLHDKPDWFLKISPFGKVPVLKVGDTVLFESAIINEYLDERDPPQMHPQDLLRRAHNRAWIEFGSSAFADMYALWTKEKEADALSAVESLKGKFNFLEEQLQDGPYFNGKDFSLVDAAIAPLLQRLKWCEDIKDLGLFDKFTKINRWKKELLNRKSVQDSILPNLQELFNDYSRGKRGASNQAPCSWLGGLIKSV